jgi:hypothetical protein
VFFVKSLTLGFTVTMQATPGCMAGLAVDRHEELFETVEWPAAVLRHQSPERPMGMDPRRLHRVGVVRWCHRTRGHCKPARGQDRWRRCAAFRQRVDISSWTVDPEGETTCNRA